MSPVPAFLTDLAVKSGILLGFTLLAATLLRERHASLKHFVITCAFTACLVLPLAQGLVKPREVVNPILATEVQDPATTPMAASRGGFSRGGAAPSSPAKAALQGWPKKELLVSTWFAGTLSCLCYWAFGRIRASILYRAASPFDRADTPNRVRIARGPDPATAVTWGYLRTFILLPASSRGWSPREVRSALDHELAHVKRRDDLAHTLGWLAVSFNWFNPLFWIALRAQRLAAELAADALVGGSRKVPADYAQDLLNIAAKSVLPRPQSSFGVTMLHSSNIEHRIKVILAGRAPSRIGALTFAAVLATSTISIATLGPLRSKGALTPTARTGLEGIEHLTTQEMALGQASNVDAKRPKLLFFGDFECPSCRKVAPAFRQIRNSGYGVVFFHFPLHYHPHARLAAQAMVAAAKQGAQWRACDTLFSMKLSDQSIRKLGRMLGIDEKRFLADLESDSTKGQVADSYNLCNRLKLNQVPTFYKLTPDGKATHLDPNAIRALAPSSASR